MNEFEEKLNAVLSDPGEMEKLSRMAARLMGGETGPDPPPEGELLGQLSKLMGTGGGGDKTALLKALSPYLRPERQARLKKALNAARLARLATTALGEYGGGEDV